MNQIPQTPIAVIGAGAWGSALAILLARNGNTVHLWGNLPEEMQAMQRSRCCGLFPDIKFPDNLTAFADLKACVADVQDLLLVVPSHVFRLVLQQLQPLVQQPVRIAWGTKGLDPEHCEFMHELVEQEFGEFTPYAVLSGPSFAKEVARGLPTAVSLAGNNPDFLADLIERFHSDTFRVYQNDDLIGVELCGALKNVLAIAIGMSDGLGFGANTRAALITRGLAEMARLCQAVGADPATLMNLAGVGDLVLTCTDDQSRNRRFGLALGKGADADQAKAEIGQAIEGFENAKQIYQLAKKYHLDMPITANVYKILYENHKPQEVVSELLERSPKAE